MRVNKRALASLLVLVGVAEFSIELCVCVSSRTEPSLVESSQSPMRTPAHRMQNS